MSLTARKATIRWMILHDMPEVMAIEQASFAYPWSEAEFGEILTEPTCNGMVAVRSGRVAGYVIFRLNRNRIDILNLAVSPDARRTGIGRQMVEKLAGKLDALGRDMLAVEADENDLSGHLFLRAVGFRAVQVVHRGDYDSYRFELTLGKAVAR